MLPTDTKQKSLYGEAIQVHLSHVLQLSLTSMKTSTDSVHIHTGRTSMEAFTAASMHIHIGGALQFVHKVKEKHPARRRQCRVGHAQFPHVLL